MRTEFQSKGITKAVTLLAGQSIVVVQNQDRTLFRMTSSDAGTFNFRLNGGDTISGTIADIDNLISHPVVTSKVEILNPGAITVNFIISHAEDVTVV